MVLCCVDRGSGASFYFPMKHKDEVRAKIKALDIIVRRSKLRISGMGVLTRDPKNLTGIASLQTDDEKIFTEGEVAKYCDKTGIDQRISPPYVHESNGLIEVTIRTDFTRARAGLVGSSVKKGMWAWALKHAAATRFVSLGSEKYGQNRSPFETWYGRRPDVSHLRPFGAPVYELDTVPRPKGKREFDNQGRLCMLIGYVEKAKGTYIICKSFRPFSLTYRGDVHVLEELPSDDFRDPMRNPAII